MDETGPVRLLSAHATPDVGPPRQHSTLADEASDSPSRASPIPASVLPVGTRLGRYHVLDEIGAGGMGVVYAAYDPELDRRVALKLLPPGGEDDEAIARLVREAQAMARLSHPNVVHVYDVGRMAGSVYITMQLVDGGTLKRWMALERRPWREVLTKFVAAAHGLAAAHAAGIVHRDFKPDNVLLGSDGSTRVVDFGLARPLASTNEAHRSISAAVSASSVLDHPLTRTGALMGTPVYMAPEQHICGDTDARTDQFSFCVALYEALYGVRPFTGPTVQALAIAVTRGNILPPPKDARVPRWLHRIVLRGLAARREDRWPDMLVLIQALERPPWRVRPGFALAAGLVVIAAGGVAGLSGSGEPVLSVCGGAQLKLSGVWDESVREQSRANAEVVGAQELAAKVHKQLDAYARRWSQNYREVCEATNVRKEQSTSMLDRRMTCLDQRLWELGGVAKLLAAGDADILSNAAAAVAGLRPPEACSSLDVEGTPIPAAQGVLREQVASLRRRLAEAKALQDAGRVADGLAVAERVVQRARELEYVPLLAQAQLRLGLAQRALGDFEAAEATLSSVAWLADEHRLEEVEALAKTELVTLVGLDREHVPAGREWGRHALAAVRRVEPEGVLAGELAYNLALVEHAAGNFEGAREQHFQALTLLERSLGPGDLRIGRSLEQMGYLELDAGMPRDASRFLDKAAQLYGSLGVQPAQLAAIEFGRARASWELGKDPEAALERAATARAGVPDDAPQAAAMDAWLAAHAT